ncbi:MAG TPA: UbiD family decarboxylase, partial [Hanamia sp.]
MAYKNLEEFIAVLENNNELVRIKEYVDPHLEIAEITDRISKSKDGGKALLFENTGYDFPVLMNAYGSEKRMCLALGVNNLNDTAKEIESLFQMLSSPKENIIDKLKLLPKLGQFASWMPRVISGRGACQQVIMKDPDITKLPVITCWPKDGG